MGSKITDKEALAYFWGKIKEKLSGKADKGHTHLASEVSGLKTVATSGSYNDLSNKPTIPSAYSHPSTHPASMITGLATVATSGSYNDLSNKPTIPTVPSSLPANGGNADTVDGYHIRTGTSGAAGYITFVV